MDANVVSKLSKAWSSRFLDGSPAVVAALSRTIPLLEDPTSVPFVVRYRGDVIAPLTTQNVHELSENLETFQSLASLRKRILAKIPQHEIDMKNRVETSISKSELEDLYAPYKPPAKGSLEDRIQSEYPGLVQAVEDYWADPSVGVSKLKPMDAAVTVLANRIASHPDTMDACQEYTNQWCRVVVKKAAAKKDEAPSKDADKFQSYHGFENALNRLREYQVLAIRRGVDKKALKITFEIDGDRALGKIRASLGDRTAKHYFLWKEAIKDAWSRLLRKRCTTRAWKAVCKSADDRAIQVFCDNLHKALLAPPAVPSTAILGLDPGFRAGIKAALLDSNGQTMNVQNALRTVQFVDNHETGKSQLMELLKAYQEHEKTDTVVIALGNGHGSREARKLVMDASESSNIPVDVHLVNEAGASVWSVTEAANREFPNEQPASVAAVSIARRYQNPLAELVKIPPRSLGLGMYQHDFAEKVLDDKLHITSIDAVAEVGVEANACSLEILEKVPGMTKKLSERIIQARPLASRNDLLKVSGLGPKTFETCAGFIRVQGVDFLDQTMCHPESYDLANYLLKKLKWDVNEPSSLGTIPSEKERRAKWKDLLGKAAKRHSVSEERVLSVLDHLIRSITNPDPRLDENAAKPQSNSEGVIRGCSSLASHLVSLDELRKACPVRDVVGHIRNIVDFGAFVDFGGENDGLLHRSKLGSVSLDSLLVGNEIGIDILGVSSNGRVTISLSGLGLPPESQDSTLTGGTGRRSNGQSRRSENKAKQKRSYHNSTKSGSTTAKRRRTNKINREQN